MRTTLTHVDILEPGLRHFDVLGTLLRDGQSAGALVMDAALAALAIEHGATLYSTDRDFSRFPNLDWRNPLNWTLRRDRRAGIARTASPALWCYVAVDHRPRAPRPRPPTTNHQPPTTNHQPPTRGDPSLSSTAYESATLLIRLYELRREPTMRDARAWYVSKFHPNSVDDVIAALRGPDSALFRMVTSYWDMAASFVLNGAIDEKMFTDANGEHVIVYAKLEPYIAEYRKMMGNPNYYASLEQLVMKAPGATERTAAIRERFRPRA